MDRLQAVLKHLNLTAEQWAMINEKRRDRLFIEAEKEMRRKERVAARVAAKKD